MLPDWKIEKLLWPENGRQTVYVPSDRASRFGIIEERQIQPASLDVRLAANFRMHPEGQPFELHEDRPLKLRPHDCVLACVVERFYMPDNLVARVEGKSTWARQFLQVHAAGFIDPGFHGDITLELKNEGHNLLVLTPGEVIAQVSFQLLDAPARRPYGSPGLGSHYQGQTGATGPAL